jgi:outer membrane biosynthesis protein TonB
VRFELVDTPASASEAKPPKDTNLMSDKNTRAQDIFKSGKNLPDSPHMEGKNETVRDTRQRMIVKSSQGSMPEQRNSVKTAAAPRRETSPREPGSSRQIEKESSGKELEPKPKPSATGSRIEVSREPEKEEVIRLARKTPASQETSVSAPPKAPSMVTTASAKNVEADAQITGELSFGATRHFFGEYLLKMKQAVERQWVSRLVSQYTGVVSSRAVIDFKIQPDGHITDMAVNSNEGDPYFPLVCVSSIDDAQPFEKIPYGEIPGLPDEYMNKPLSIRFTFQYN